MKTITNIQTEPLPLGITTEVVEELIGIIKDSNAVSKQESQPPTTPSGQWDRAALAREMTVVVWQAYFRFLLGQAMIDHGRINEANFPFITKITKITKPGPEEPSVKFSTSRGYSKASRMVRERQKWFLQMTKLYRRCPTVTDAQAGLQISAFSSELTTLIEKDFAEMSAQPSGRQTGY